MSLCRILKCVGQTHLRSFNRSFEPSVRHALKATPSATNDFINAPWQTVQVRQYGRKNRKPRTPYTKPLTFEYSGDLKELEMNVDLSEPCLGYEKSEESTDEVFKKIFSLQFATRSKVIERMLDDIVKEIQDHPLDIRSMEVEIAKLTVIIRNQIKHCEVFRHDHLSIRSLRRRIEERSVILEKLLAADSEKFDWLTNNLKIKFSGIAKYVKKEKLPQRIVDKNVAHDAAAILMRQKSEEFQKKLEQERERFNKYKEEELRKIEVELKELGINEMENLTDTLRALGREDLIPKQIRIPTEKELIQERRVGVLMKLKEEKDEAIYKRNNFISPKYMSHMPDSYFF